MAQQFLEDSSAEQAQNTIAAEDKFCLVRCSHKNDFDVVPQRCITAPSDTIETYETYQVEINGNQCQGTVILKGTKRDCERLQSSIALKNKNDVPATIPDTTSQSSTEQSIIASSTAALSTANMNEAPNDATNDDDEEDENTNQNDVFMTMLQLLVNNSVRRSNHHSEEEIHKVRCVTCRTFPIKRDRYKCLNCEDMNLCSRCFLHRKESREHKSGHAFAHFQSPGELFGQAVKDSDVTISNLKMLYINETHESIICNGCNRESIQGLRFKCSSCSNYNLCQQCVDGCVITKSHKLTHSLVVVSRRVFQQIPAEDIKIDNQIASGTFGSIYKARWLSKKRRVTCKMIILPNTNTIDMLEKNFLKDLATYSELSGTYILKTYGYATLKQDENVKYMVLMEYMSRGSLSKVIRENGSELSLRRRLDMARNIASGMRKIHEHELIHRDIQPDNIFVNENDVAKIGDMGIARFLDPFNQQTQINCQSYMPPEYYHSCYDETLDIFTFGLTLNEIFTSTRHSFQTIPTGKISLYNTSPIFGDLITRCIAYDPKRRPTAKEIERSLDLYGNDFNERVLMKHPRYMSLSTKEKDKIFISFYEKFTPHAIKIIEKEFPFDCTDETRYAPGVKIDKSAVYGNIIHYSVQ